VGRSFTWLLHCYISGADKFGMVAASYQEKKLLLVWLCESAVLCGGEPGSVGRNMMFQHTILHFYAATPADVWLQVLVLQFLPQLLRPFCFTQHNGRLQTSVLRTAAQGQHNSAAGSTADHIP